MKGIILAAGKGTRLAPLTNTLPKVMVNIGGKPLLLHHLEWLKRYDIRKVGVNLYHLPEIIQNYFGDGSSFGMTINYSKEKKILGTSGGLKCFEKFVGNETCLVIYGDNLFDLDLKDFLRFHKEHQGIATIAVKEWEDPTSKGIIEMSKQKKILAFKEKPQHGETSSRIGNAGIYLLEPQIFQYIPQNTFSDFGHDIFPKLLHTNKKLYAYRLNGYHIDIGTHEMLEKAKNDFLDRSHS